MPSVLIPTPLRKLTDGLDTVQTPAGDIASLINSLETSFPGLKERICDAEGEVRRFVNVYVNGEDIRFLEGTATVVAEKDEVSIVPAIAGG